MSFLTPLYLLGGLAIALPVVFHLVRRASRDRMVFSSLMFLQPTPPRLTRRNRVEHWLLLALRCLVILALAAAFARPFLRQPTAAPTAATGSARTLLLVDTSASMRREGLWAAALSRAEAVLRRAGPADQVAVFTFDTQARPVVSFEEWDRSGPAERAAFALRQLRELQPGWLATQTGQALVSASEALEAAAKSSEAGGPKRIVLITDLQEGSHIEAVQGHDWARGLEVVVEVVRAGKTTNAGLQWIAESEDAEFAARDTDLRLRVINSSDARSEQFQIRWDDAAAGGGLDAYVPPGQGRIVAGPKPAAGATSGRLTLSGDDDPFDNTVYVVPPRSEQVAVLFVGEQGSKDPAHLAYYLKRAFVGTRRQGVTLDEMQPGALAGAQGSVATHPLVVTGSNLPEASAAVLRNHLEAGATVLFVLDRLESGPTLGSLAGVAALSVTEAPASTYAMLGKMDFQHPMLAPFADPRFSDFTKIRFWNHRRLDLDAWPAARVVARFDQDDPAIIEAPVGKGRLVVFAFSWRPAQSQLALSSKFVPLINSLLDQAVGAKPAPAQVRVGDPVELAALQPRAGAALSVRKPDGTRVELPAGATRFSGADQPGVYEATMGTNLLKFAVNLDPAESRTGPLPGDEMTRLGVPVAASEAAPGPSLAKPRQWHNAELEGRQKYWRLLLMAALGLLLLETWLAGWLTRRAATRAEVPV
jgi:hypothetical protein